MATPDCRRVAAALRDGPLEALPPAAAARARAHVATCADCRRAAQEYRGAAAALQAHYARVPGPALPPAARARLATPPAAPLRGRPTATVAATVALCAIVLALAMLLPRGAAPPSTPGAVGNQAGAPPAGTPPAVVCPAVPGSPAPTPATDGVEATATTLAAANQRPQVREDRCTPPVAGLITLDQAAAATRAFLGEPAAALTAGYVPVSNGFGGDTPAGYLVSLRRLGATGAAAADVFNVDARTGTVSGVSALAWVAPAPGDVPIDANGARDRATAYAAAHQPAFPQLAPRAGRDGGTPDLAEFLWQGRDGASGAWLPTSLRVIVSLRSSAIVGYAWFDTPYSGPTAPTLTAAEARARADDAARADARYAGLAAETPVLEAYAAYTLNSTQTTPRLVWTVAYPGQGSLYVDALTGEVLRGEARG